MCYVELLPFPWELHRPCMPAIQGAEGLGTGAKQIFLQALYSFTTFGGGFLVASCQYQSTVAQRAE